MKKTVQNLPLHCIGRYCNICLNKNFIFTEKEGVAKRKRFSTPSFRGFRKIVQNGQTEQKQGKALLLVPEGVHRYIERRSLFIA